MLSALGSLVSLCISYIDIEKAGHNHSTGLLDLTPLYGFTEEDSKEIRAYDDGFGQLLPDAFFETGERLHFLPPAVSVLLILFNRNHNHIARRIFQENEEGSWVDPATLEGDEEALENQDRDIFLLARRINCGLFRNIVVNDFLKGLLGLGSHESNPAIDLLSGVKPEELETHHVSVEFSLAHNWSGSVSNGDVDYISNAMEEEFGNAGDNVNPEQLKVFYETYASNAVTNRGRRACVGLERNEETDRFEDADLANILLNATESIAFAPGVRNTPVNMRVFELATLKQARDWQVCSFNEFRKLLGLPAYRDFNEWSSIPEVARAAQAAYGNIDKLELYTGLRGEKTLTGPGFCLGETTTQALIVDIVKLIRSDPMFTQDFTQEVLTDWGYKELRPDSNNGAFGAFLPKLLSRNLPNSYPHNNVYGLFPLTIPSKMREHLAGIEPAGFNYDFSRPVTTPVKIIDNADQIISILGDPENYPPPHVDGLYKITGGYGHLVTFDDKQTHDRDEFHILKSLIPDCGALGRFGEFFKRKTEEYIKKSTSRIDDTRCQLDIIRDVINDVSVAWAAEQICGVPLNTPSGYTEKELYGMLLDLSYWVLGNVEAQDHVALLARGTKAAKTLINDIVYNEGLAEADPDSKSTAAQTAELLLELFGGEPPEHSSAEEFLARLVISGVDKRELGADDLELAVLSSITFSQVISTAVRFYLDDRRISERQVLHDLATQGPEVNNTVMGYIRESHRLDPYIGSISRNVVADRVLTGEGLQELSLTAGEKIILDWVKAREDQPTDIDPNRNTKIYHGPGLFKFLDEQFIPQTMPEVFKAIFRLKDIRLERKAGIHSALISYRKPKPPKPKKVKRPRSSTPHVLRHSCDVFLIILAITIVYWAIFAIGRSITRRTCLYPRHYRPWEVYTLLPGPDNQTLPFINTLSHPRPRWVSFVDADERDMRFRVIVDGRVKRVSSNFDVSSENCGTEANRCVNGGWSSGSVKVPSGKHTVRVEWIGKDFVSGTNSINWGRDRKRRILWKQELC
ncbi:hypothetical protein AX15_004355 [Amanita polypyramis BW_CC]|nr:hypothetical protein AX15_004355 [Amanita polypyramis BW_CC]